MLLLFIFLEQLKQREQELKELKSKFESMDRKRIEEEKGLFLKEISKRDNHIKLLRNQLSQAIDDIEAQTRVIESLIEKNIETIHKSDHPESSSTGATDSQVLNGKQLIAKLEEELKSKDKEMTILHQRNTLYEQGIYGLSEAVEEINKLSKLTRSKDNEIESLIKELNSINLKLSNTQDELDYLKEFMNADDDLKRKLNEESDVKNDKLKILKLQKEVIRLDAEKLRLYEELLSFKLGGGPTKPKKPADLLNSDLTEISNQSTKDDLKDIKQLQKLNSLQELENENRELQLAMKEILIGLKESDSKSDVIIDCPSLERLCQFFESRSINSSLANVIALKAELDILRGHNEELRMTNKRLRNDIFKIFENYSKQLLTDFVNKHDSEKEAKDGPTNMEKNNQTLTEDELYDSDLSEGEIVLNSISVKKSRKQQNQETQTDAEDLLRQNSDAQEDKRKPEKSLDKNHSTSKTSSDDDFNKSSLDAGRPDGADRPAANEPLEENGAKSSGQAKDQTPMDLSADVSEQNTFTIEKSFIEQNTQTDLCLEDLKNANHLKEINSLNLSVDDLKSFVHQKDLIDKPAGSASLPKKDATSQTIDIPLTTDATGCAQCSMVQNLLVEFQNKIDRIDSSVVQREDLFTERINVLQQENNRLQTELQKIVQIKDDLLNQKDKQIIELNDRIVSQREKVLNLEESLKSRRESSEKKENDSKKEESPPSVDKGDTSLADQTSLDKQSIDKQLAIINKGALDSTNQRGLINILETIIKCLQARIEHKDEAIAHYQQLLTKTQEEHQKEIQKLMKNYEKVTQHSIKAIQSSSNVNQEHLESTLAKYNEQLNEQKAYHQKQLAEQMKAFELQSCKMKRIKSENERLKSQAGSMEELNRLRLENDQLNKMVEKNVKFIEKLKNAIREERDAKQDAKSDLRGRQEEKGRLMMIGKLKEEIENLHKVMISKDKHIKELQLAKWNLEKKIGEVMQANKAELKAKSEELEKMISDQTRLRNQLERLEKERSASRRRQATVIKEPKMEDKEMRVEKVVKFEDNSGAFMEKFRQLDQTISTLKMQLQNCAHRERELISLLETKGLARNEVRERVRGNVSRENASEDVRPKKEFSIQTIKGKKFEIRKNSCDF